MKCRKKVSKRMTCKRKYKIQKKVREHKRKLKKELKNKKKVKVKDPGIPNSLPFKDKVLQEVEELKKAKQLEILQKKKAIKPKQALTNLCDEAAKKTAEFEGMMDLESTTAVDKISYDQKIPTEHKFFKEFYQVVESADVVLHVLDARDPINTRSSQVEQAVINSGTTKRLILVLNKIDLIPHENLLLWLRYLRNEFPTVAFKASTQDQRDNLSQSRKGIKDCNERLLQSSKCIGADMLMKLLQSYCYKDENFKKEEKASIRVGVVGFPNVGKSSIINSLKRSKVCCVGSNPGVTRSPEEVHLTKNIQLIDSPGVVHVKPDSGEIAYVNVSRIEDIKEPDLIAVSILKRFKPEYLMLMYRLPEFSSPEQFLFLLSKRLGRLKKGGIPDVEAAARKFLMDWNRGRIKYYTRPPSKQKLPSYISSEIVETMGKSFDLSILENDNDLTNIDVPVLPLDAIDITENENHNDNTEEKSSEVSLFITDKMKSAANSEDKIPEFTELANGFKQSMKKQRKKQLKRLKKKRKRQEKTSVQLSESLVTALATFND